jgi:sugar phosphate permease
MSQKLERREWVLVALCALVYFFNYFCRCNFTATLAAMVEGLDTTKTLISIALTGNAITYGAGQAVCGVLGDRISPRIFISVGLIGSALCNLAVGMVSIIPVIWVLWSINGIMQAMIWPALMRAMTEQLSRRAFMVAMPAVSYACSISTFAVYMGLVPLCLSISSWRMSFIIPGIIKSYSYAMSFYIKHDHPEYDWKQCIDESRRMMDGHKWQLFCLDFSFIGWNLLGFLCCGIGLLWVAPYEMASRANFYENLKALYDPEIEIPAEETPVEDAQ